MFFIKALNQEPKEKAIPALKDITYYKYVSKNNNIAQTNKMEVFYTIWKMPGTKKKNCVMKNHKLTETRIWFVMLVELLFVMPTYSELSRFSKPNKTYPEIIEYREYPSPFVAPEMSCGSHQDRKNRYDAECEGSASSTHCETNGCYLSSTLATMVYFICCPETECLFFTEPCPRKGWDKKVRNADMVTCEAKGVATRYHYWTDGFPPDTLYDAQMNHMVDVSYREKKELTGPRRRFHTCVQATPVMNLRVVAYGLGWIYFKWRKPPVNCRADVMYTEEYEVANDNGTYAQPDVGDYTTDGVYTGFKKFHPCPQYPNWFCFIISENVPPFRDVTFKVKYKRFGSTNDADKSDWASITTRTNDVSQIIKFCPTPSFFLTIWFLIILIILFLLLLIVAMVMIALLVQRKKKQQRKDDMKDEPYEEEAIGPSNKFEKIWERLKNFFNQLCPRPKKPPPPPPPPPPKPKKPKPPKKPKKEKKKEKKPKPVKKPKPRKTKTPSPSPPPPPPAPKKKARRGPRADRGRRTEGAKMDTKRAVSAVGGVRGRRPRR